MAGTKTWLSVQQEHEIYVTNFFEKKVSVV